MMIRYEHTDRNLEKVFMFCVYKKTLRGWIQKSISVSVKVENKQFHIFYILCPINQNQNILSTSSPLGILTILI